MWELNLNLPCAVSEKETVSTCFYLMHDQRTLLFIHLCKMKLTFCVLTFFFHPANDDTFTQRHPPTKKVYIAARNTSLVVACSLL